MAEEPETLEETQARLARVGQTPQQPPTVPTASPGTPYGPGAQQADLTGSDEFGTAAQRPDPYAASPLPAPVEQSATIGGSRRSLSVIAGIAAVTAVLAVGGFVAFFAVGGGPPDPSGVDEPEFSDEWQTFPGVSWAEPSTALDQASYEEVVAGTDVLITQYRDALSAEFGLVWTQSYESYSGLEGNGYGGDSMLYYYDSGSWQGHVKLEDATARERVLEIFTQLTAANGGEGVLLRNDVYEDDEVASLDQFGAVDREDQALWSFFDSFPELAGMYLGSDVIDRTIPTDASFTGDFNFTYDDSDDTFYVTIDGYVGALLKEADRAAFEAALEPYGGDYTP